MITPKDRERAKALTDTIVILLIGIVGFYVVLMVAR